LIASCLGISKNCKEKKDLIVKSDKNNACKIMKTDVRFDEYGFEIFNLNHDFRPFTYGKEKFKKKSS
jgi:hypothetical protein